ncbi:P53 and DNA damage-regulated protein 1 [Aphelenchoides besseyi]|nr:P53 and DNA damage-regulated protein 1 [Aphelenchoides besseyi]KAI6222773.1 P53 and DNA damage-regulated protein 1 [Aphelenchoides besseyi]
MNDEQKMSSMGSALVDKVTLGQQLGQRIVNLENSLIQLNIQQAKLRESFHAVGRSVDSKSKTFTAVCPGLLVQFPNDYLKPTIQRDVKQVENTITQTREELRNAVDQLRKLEGDRDLKALGFNLEAINSGRD